MKTKNSGKKVKNNKLPLLFGALGVFAIILVGLDRSDLLRTPDAVSLEIGVEEAYAQWEDDTFILDVRTVEEWEEHHIEGATLIPLDTLAGAVEQLPRGQAIIVVCRSGNRSATGRDILLAAGFTDVVSMRGGMNDWLAANYPYATGP